MTPEPMPIVVGAPRSGTTMLRLMLDAHPQLAIPPETDFLKYVAHLPRRPPCSSERFVDTVAAAGGFQDLGVSRRELEHAISIAGEFDLAEATRSIYRLYASRHGKPRWGDKTPLYLFELEAIERLLGEARFIHVIRDGRDVAVSQRGMWFVKSAAVEDLASDWVRWVTTGRRLGARVAHYAECRYEDLVRDPRGELERLCSFTDLRFDDAMLAFHRRAGDRLAELGDRRDADGEVVVRRAQRLAALSATNQPVSAARVGRWRTELSADEQRSFEAIAGELLTELGYPLDDPPEAADEAGAESR